MILLNCSHQLDQINNWVCFYLATKPFVFFSWKNVYTFTTRVKYKIRTCCTILKDHSSEIRDFSLFQQNTLKFAIFPTLFSFSFLFCTLGFSFGWNIFLTTNLCFLKSDTLIHVQVVVGLRKKAIKKWQLSKVEVFFSSFVGNHLSVRAGHFSCDLRRLWCLYLSIGIIEWRWSSCKCHSYCHIR